MITRYFFLLLSYIIVMELSSTGRCLVEEKKKQNQKLRNVKRIYVMVFMVVIVTLSALLES